jgi:hypothetical protein
MAVMMRYKRVLGSIFTCTSLAKQNPEKISHSLADARIARIARPTAAPFMVKTASPDTQEKTRVSLDVV